MRLKVNLALVLAAALCCAAPAWSASNSPGAETASSGSGAAAAQDSGAQSQGGRLRAALHRLSPGRILADRLFKRASATFPAFCRDWESKLKTRERDNLQHITWTEADGSENATYVGYGDIQSCTCKQTSKGIPIGKLSYQEFQYQVSGKTREQALQSPRPATVTNTTEIFRYDKRLGKWVY